MAAFPAPGDLPYSDKLKNYIDEADAGVLTEAGLTATEAAEAYLAGQLPELLGVTDSQAAALINTKGSQTEQALTATLATATGAMRYKRDAGGEKIASAAETGAGVTVVTILSDSTANDPDDWPAVFLAAVAARYPNLHVERSTWSDPAQAYAAPVVLNAGTNYTPGQPSGVARALTETFTRTGELLGSAATLGGSWTNIYGTAPTGAWATDGTKLTRTATAAAAPHVRLNTAYAAGDVTLNVDDFTTSTVAGGAVRYMGFYIRSAANIASNLELRLGVSTSGILTATFSVVTPAGTVLSGVDVVTGVASNTASVTFDIKVEMVGRTVTATIGSFVKTYTITEAQHAALTGTYFGLYAPETWSGTSISGITLDVDRVGAPASGNALIVWNASFAGSKLSYHQPRINAMVPVETDVLIVSSSHNYTYDAPAPYLAEFTDVIADALVRAPDASVVVSSQNPEFYPGGGGGANAAHQARLVALRARATAEGWGYIPAFEAYRALPDGGASLMADSVHPAPAGHVVWAQVAQNWLDAHFYTAL